MGSHSVDIVGEVTNTHHTMTTTDTSPRDPYNLVMAMFYYLAIGTLLPWNFFINVNGYWMYKFRTVNSTDTTNLTDTKNRLQLEFTSDLAVAAMIPNVTFLILNGLFGHRFKTTPRLLWSLCIVVALFIFTLVLVKVDTDTWQQEFLALTLTTIVIINIFTAIFQGGLFGLAGCFPSKYMNAVLGGQGIGGIFAATINILLLAIGGDDVSAAFYCFLLSVIFLTGSVLALIIVTRTEFYQHYIAQSTTSTSSMSESSPLLNQTDTEDTKTISVKDVMKTIWVEGLTVLIIYIVTLACFPALTVLVESTNKNKPGSSSWENQYFVPVTCFLFYNIGDYIGRFIAASPVIPNIGSKVALVLSCTRIIFIPLFLFCNLAPNERHITAVYFYSDGVYIALVFLLAISNGFLTSVVMVNAPTKVEFHQQQTSSNMMVGILGLGLVLGAAGSGALVKLL